MATQIQLINIIGWLGAFLLATCSLPQLIKTIKTKKFEGLSLTFVIWWLLGEIFTLSYIFHVAFKWPLIFNYTINILATSIILGLFIGIKLKSKNKLI
jgi:uncharacterized protein with PQ loop repeat